VRYRSLIWPAILILAGAIALLLNTGVISADRLVLLVNLWPLILIVVGIELIVRRSVQGAAGDAAAVAIIVAALLAATAYVAVAPTSAATSSFQTSAAAGDLKEASLEIDVGGATFAIQDSRDIGSDLYRAAISYSGSKPDVRLNRSDAKLTIEQHERRFLGLPNPALRMTLDLNPAIKWTITENTGASTDTIDLPHTAVSALTINTGASREDLALGPATGIVPVEINGVALTVHLHRPSNVEASVRVSGGAISLDADGHASHGIGERTYQSAGYADASDAYRITVDGGACTVTLDTTS
jgi:hypothetical protein